MAAAMDLERPSCLLHLPHDASRFVERSRMVRKVERVGPHTSEAQCRGDTARAPARGGIGYQAAIGTRERFDGRPRVLETFAEKLRSDLQDFRGFGAGQLEDFAQHVRQTV